MLKERKVLIHGEILLIRKVMRFAGKDYKVDDPFPYRRLSVSERKVRQLYDSGYLKRPPVEKPVEGFPNKRETKQAVKKFNQAVKKKPVKKVSKRKAPKKKKIVQVISKGDPIIKIIPHKTKPEKFNVIVDGKKVNIRCLSKKKANDLKLKILVDFDES